MNQFILCIGLPGTGKSTSSNLLEERLDGYIRLNIPEIQEKLGITTYDRSGAGKERMDEYFREVEQRISNGEGIIVDRVGSKRYPIRQYYYNQAIDFGRDVLVVYHTASEETAKSRIRNRPDPGDSSLPSNDPNIYDTVLGNWEDPEQDLAYAFNSHVSMIKYDTESNTFQPVRVRPHMKDLVEIVIEILSIRPISSNPDS